MAVAELDPPRTSVDGSPPSGDVRPAPALPGEMPSGERLIGVGIGILAERHHLSAADAWQQLLATSHDRGLPVAAVVQELLSGEGPAPEQGDDEPQGFIALDRGAHGLVLTFTGDVTRSTVRRFQLLVPAAEWPGRVDLRQATFLSPAALGLVRQLASKQRRAGARLNVDVSGGVVAHQLRATGAASLASIRTS